jgi:hypothetical protein
LLISVRTLDKMEDEPNESIAVFDDPYDTFFALSVASILVLGVCFAISWAMWIRRHDTVYATRHLQQHVLWGRHVCNAMLVLTIEACMSLLVWAAVTRGVDHLDENPRIIGIPGLIAAIVLLWFPLVCMTDFLAIRSEAILGILIVVSTLFLLIPGLVIISMYSRQMAYIQGFTYLGPMRVTGFRAEMRHRRGINGHDVYFGKPEMSWGGEWGCPQSPDTWCKAAVFEPDCIYCDDPKYTDYIGSKQGNGADAVECVALEYKMDRWCTIINFLDPTFDKNVSPEEDDVQWPSATFFGNCETCQAEEIGSIKVRRSNAEKLRHIGLGALIGGLVVYAGISLYLAISKTIQKLHHDGLSSRDGEEENHYEEEDSSQNQQTDASCRVADEENQESNSSRESIEDEQNQNSVLDDPNQQTDDTP